MKARDVLHGRFEIERLAGHGGMGTVFRALDRQTGRPVAVKVILGGGAELVERFGREVDVLAGLSHPGIVRFVASGITEDEEPYLAMEWLEGEGLDERLSRGPLSISETIDLGLRVASALSVAHARGVVHRDLKPSNLFLVHGQLANVTLLDFGIARTGSGEVLTRSGQTLGSPGYTAPEQARGERGIDARADVFSLGCVLYFCLTGQPPFRGALLEILLKVATEPAPLASSRRPDVPPALEDLLQRMLAKPPSARPPDASAVAVELAALAAQGSEPISSAPVPVPVPEVSASPRTGTGKPRVLLLVLGVVVLVLVTLSVLAALLLASSSLFAFGGQ
jgi:serine/threonine protein kinase